METRIDLRKEVRIHEALAEVFNKLQFKELTYEVMFFLFAKLTKSHKDETIYTLDINEFQTLTGKQANLGDYKKAITELRKITFEIETDEYVLIDGVLSNAKFMKGAGTMIVKISSDMKPFLLDLVSNYTAPQLYSILRLRSKHAKKLYLYFYGLRPKKGCLRTILDETTIKEFKINTGYINGEGEELYKQWIHFKDRVLDVAKEEINAVSNIKVAYYPRKLGREYYYIEWHIENKNNTELIALEEFGKPIVELPEMSYEQRMTEIGFLSALIDELKLHEWQAKQVLKQTAPVYLHLNEVIETVKTAFKMASEKGNPISEDKKGGYAVKAIFNKYGIDLKKKPKL